MTRKLASLRKINKILPIDGADSIDCAIVDGWNVVIRKNEFFEGELAVYLEIDSWVPHHLAPFLSKGQTPREYEGVLGERLRTAKLRGKLSQGLLLKADCVDNAALTCGGIQFPCIEGYDLTETLNIKKWEAAIPAQLSGDIKGSFPSFVPRTDQERIQNLSDDLGKWVKDDMSWEVTEKLDGSSMTVYFNDGNFGVCSRNWELKDTSGNSLWEQTRKFNLENVLSREGNFAVQGEIIGEGIQGNPYKIKGQDFYVYDVFDINRRRYLSPLERQEFTKRNGLKHVPIIAVEASLSNTLSIQSMEDVLKFAEGKSTLFNGVEREGVVFKHGGLVSFKAISNKFLLKFEK